MRGFVRALVVDKYGDLYVGGDFLEIGGYPRENIAKLSGITGIADPVWNPASNASVLSLALNGSGDVYAGGEFTEVGGQPRNYIAKLTGDAGTADPSWNPSANQFVESIVVDSSGAVYAAGGFSEIGGQARTYLARLVGSNGAAESWNPEPGPFSMIFGWDGWSPGLYRPRVLNLDRGTVYVGGAFHHIGGQSRDGLAAFPNLAVFAHGFE